MEEYRLVYIVEAWALQSADEGLVLHNKTGTNKHKFIYFWQFSFLLWYSIILGSPTLNIRQYKYWNTWFRMILNKKYIIWLDKPMSFTFLSYPILSYPITPSLILCCRCIRALYEDGYQAQSSLPWQPSCQHSHRDEAGGVRGTL